MADPTGPPFGFVADGCQRAREANEPVVRAEVEREFAAKLAEATDRDRQSIWQAVEREVERRLNRLAPPDALY
jgi:hypothetical protein